MPEGDSYVTEGALLRCDKGVVPTPLTIVGPRASRVNGRLQATMVDCVPLVNIKPFGVCAITHGPCMPPALVWTQTYPGGRLVGGALPLLESSVCQCGLGGRISINVLPVPGMPPVGSGGAGLAALGEAEYARHQAQEQALAERDAAAHEASHGLKQASGALAIVGLGCLLVGCLFPPALLVGAVALELAEATLVVGVAVDVAVAIDHPTQDNWVTVGGDALALVIGYAVGRVIVGAIGRWVAPAVEEEIAAETAAEVAPAAAPKPVYESAANKPRGMPLTAAEVEAQFGKEGVDLVNETQAEALRVGATQATRPRGPVLSGVKDPLTGETHFGQNMDKVPDDLHPLLEGRVEAYEAQIKAGKVDAAESDLSRAGQPGTHSEISALDKAIKAREAITGKPMQESELNDFLLHNRSLMNKTLGEGVPPRCVNCWHITKGVRVIGND